jgi:heme A synthase
MDTPTVATSGAGVAFLLALLNGWLASHRSRSAVGWFLGTMILTPIAVFLTLYLLSRPTETRRPSEERLIGVAAAGLWVVAVVLLLGALVLTTYSAAAR